MSGLQLFWFILIAVLFGGFFFLEGFDFGVGMSVLALARNKREVNQAIATIGPFWDMNEVWLLTAGGAMFASFPYWYASLFSGYYNWTKAPGWIIDNIGAINIFISTYAKALMTVFLFAIVYRLWKTKKEEISVFSLAILTTMGITLFHTLLWEVKPRYQFMTFALIILAAALSFDKIFSEKTVFRPEKGRSKLLKIAYPIMALLSLGLMLTLMQKQLKQAIVVNAQQHSVNHFGYSKGSRCRKKYFSVF